MSEREAFELGVYTGALLMTAAGLRQGTELEMRQAIDVAKGIVPETLGATILEKLMKSAKEAPRD